MSEAVREHYKLATTGHLKAGGSVKHEHHGHEHHHKLHETHGHEHHHEMHEKHGHTPHHEMCHGGKAYKAGGAVKHDDVAEDKKLIKKEVKASALKHKKHGGKC